MQVNLDPQTQIIPARPDPADRLEQAFLEEMLKYCGPPAGKGEFSGGIGEEQFTSFLTQEWAGLLATRIDLGFGAIMAGRQA